MRYPNGSLLQDHEIEVRAATIKDISSFVDLVGPPTFASEVMPHVLALLQDVNLVGVAKGSGREINASRKSLTLVRTCA